MRAVLQRALRGHVSVGGDIIAALPEPGIVALIGVRSDDTDEDIDYIVRKIADLRILHEEKSALDLGAPILVISQFTLYAATRKGRRPTWNQAAPGHIAEPMVDRVARGLHERGLPVFTGEFGADMKVELVNDGPFTILLDSREN